MKVNHAETTVDRIVAIEWEMFQRVNEDGPRAECQENPNIFKAMREGQFNAWSDAAASSYLSDLERAARDGRNLVAEKYIHMMKNTDPFSYEKLAAGITPPDSKVLALADEIADRLLRQTARVAEQFPGIIAAGRPLRSDEDGFDSTSVETYQKGELMTYSENTLVELRNHIDALEREGVPLARLILENYAGYYGYETLEDAEEHAKRRMISTADRPD
jgi:hypothetical protein